MDSPSQIDLFQVSAFEPPLRDNKDVMEYPFLSIQKGRRKPIQFTSPDGKISVHVSGNTEFGIANIWDWDLMIYLSAQLNDGIEQGASPSQWIEFPPYDALRYMGRGTGGKDYRELVKTIRRLATTDIITSIRIDETRGEEGNLNWLESYRIPKKYRANQFIQNTLDDGEADGSKPWRVKLPEWIFKAICRQTGILAVHPKYLELTGGLERWLYRLARKSVPGKESWAWRMDTLHKRSGSTRPLRNFALDVRKIAAENKLPEYGLYVHKKGRNELVTMYRDIYKPRRLPRGIPDMIE